MSPLVYFVIKRCCFTATELNTLFYASKPFLHFQRSVCLLHFQKTQFKRNFKVELQSRKANMALCPETLYEMSV